MNDKNDKKTLQSASFKNKYLFKIQIILVDILTRAYHIMTKRILVSLNIFTRKN